MIGDRLAVGVDFDASDNGVLTLPGQAVVPGGEAINVDDAQGVVVLVAGFRADDRQDEAFSIAGGATGDGLADFGE